MARILGSTTLIGCMAHARRYFEKALTNDQTRAAHALKEIQKLYTIEREAKEAALTVDELTERRKEKAVSQR